MASVFRLKILTLEKIVLDADVVSIVVPGVDGYFGVLAHHAPLTAALQPGKLTVKEANGTESIYAISGGFLEVSGNVATLLADAVERACDIDLARAEAAREDAVKMLSSSRTDADTSKARAALCRATTRIEISRSQTSD
jgi:F-type H+-transporting ATPase subunit epsilon